MNPVAIIGAGITGLTAAFRLHQKKIPVVVYDSADRVGGVIQSMRQSGYLAEFGPNTLLETSPKITEVIRDLELGDRMQYSDPAAKNRYLVRGRRTIAMPGSFFGFLATPLFSTASKLHLFREPFVKAWDNRYEENLAQFVKRRLDQEFLDYAIDPLVAGVYAGDPYRLSVQHAFPKLYALEQKYGSLIKGQVLGAKERRRRAEVSKQNANKISFTEGLQVLPDAMLAALGSSVQLQTPVTRVVHESNQWMLTVGPQDKRVSKLHSAVLYAGPAYRLAELDLSLPAPVDLKPLAKINYPPVASIVIGFRREDVRHPLDGFGMLIPKLEGFSILGTLFSSSLFPGRAPEGHVTLTSYVGGMRHPDLALHPVKDLVALTIADLRVLLGIQGEPTFEHCILYPRAIPQYDVGYGEFKAIMDQLEQRAAGVFLAGHYRNGVSLSDSLIAGYEVADRMEAYLKQNA